jgi:hypothetical protein
VNDMNCMVCASEFAIHLYASSSSASGSSEGCHVVDNADTSSSSGSSGSSPMIDVSSKDEGDVYVVILVSLIRP